MQFSWILQDIISVFLLFFLLIITQNFLNCYLSQTSWWDRAYNKVLSLW